MSNTGLSSYMCVCVCACVFVDSEDGVDVDVFVGVGVRSLPYAAQWVHGYHRLSSLMAWELHHEWTIMSMHSSPGHYLIYHRSCFVNSYSNAFFI